MWKKQKEFKQRTLRRLFVSHLQLVTVIFRLPFAILTRNWANTHNYPGGINSIRIYDHIKSYQLVCVRNIVTE